MRITLYFKNLLLIIAILFSVSCSKKDSSYQNEVIEESPKEVDIYLFGINSLDGNFYVQYKKNSEELKDIIYPVSFNFRELKVKGDDLYILGHETSGSLVKPFYLKNEFKTSLNSGDYTLPYKFDLQGNDVITVGRERIDGKFKAKVWKNANVLYNLSQATEDYPVDFKVINNDIYTLTNEMNGTEFTKIKVWKNNTIVTEITNEGRDLYGIYLTVHNNDIYVGREIYDTRVRNFLAAYWKNGERHNISDELRSYYLQSFDILDNKPHAVYQAYTTDPNFAEAYYWIDNARKVIAYPADLFNNTGSTVHRGNIYSVFVKSVPPNRTYKV